MLFKPFSLSLLSLVSLASAQNLVHTGNAIFTNFGGGFGVCGFIDNGNIVQVSSTFFNNFPGASPNDPSHNPICGKTITATALGQTVNITVVDKCASCALFDLGLSPATFSGISTSPSPTRVTWFVVGGGE